MKKLTLGIIVGIVVFTLIAWKSDTGSGSGKYILFSGVYLYNAKGSISKRPGIFKMDTTTGNCWIYKEGHSSSNRTSGYSGWKLIQSK